MKKENAYQRIQRAMKENDAAILKIVREHGLPSYRIFHMSTFNSLHRLEAKGLVRYSKKDFGYVATKKR